jgi:hypothetical protein
LGVWQLLEDNDEARLRPGSVDGVGQALLERIEILAARLGKMKVLADATAHLLLGQRVGAMGVQEVLPKANGFLLQFHDTESANGLHKVRRHCYQQTHFSLKSTCSYRFFYRVIACALRSWINAVLLMTLLGANTPYNFL